ncbi:phosphopantetheine-binding protein [Streptomyces sp. NBC_01077]|uniref:acyl carrier protein n=1 Tax=Streptomyces sp. NBC_01077 TaxID=2903746 RepID=UPI00387088AF|nr:phosphopantetheine-binding protein [Streptomyces sp. NBC_01077]
MSTPTQQDTAIRETLTAFLEQRTKSAVAPDVDLFSTGLVTSLFAMELLVHVEQSFGVQVGGSDLTLDNFRSVDAMTALVLRLRGAGDE